MKFAKLFKHPDKVVLEAQNTDRLSEINIVPGDTILAWNDDGTPYGACGAVLATQMDFSRQIENRTSIIKHH